MHAIIDQTLNLASFMHFHLLLALFIQNLLVALALFSPAPPAFDFLIPAPPDFDVDLAVMSTSIVLGSDICIE